MKHLYIVGRPSTTDLMRNAFPHNNPFAHVIVAASLQEALQASQILTPDQSPFEDTLNHLGMPQAMVIYHAQTEMGPPVINAEPGKTQNAYGTIFTHLQIKDIDIMLGEDALHPAEAKKDTAVASACLEMHSNLWNRTRHLEEYTQALNIYTNTPQEAWKTWFKNVADAERGNSWHVPGSAASYFQMYYELSPFKGDVERSAQFATAKTANYLSQQPTSSAFRAIVLVNLENNAMLATSHVSALYGHQMAPHDFEAQILRHTLPILEKIQPIDREAFVKGVQTTGEIWNGTPAEEILNEAYVGFKRNHPAYKNSLDTTVQDVIDSMHSPVPMMVYGYAEGVLQQKYHVVLDKNAETAFRKSLNTAEGFSEMQRIGAALEQVFEEKRNNGYQLPAGMDVVQGFTQAHLQSGMYTPVCFAWVPDDIRPDAERTFSAQSMMRDSTLSMVYALASSITQCNQEHNSALMMRDISTILNEVTMQAVRAGVSPVDVSELMNDVFENTQDDIGDNFEEPR